MPQIIEDALTSRLAAWIDSNRPDDMPSIADLPVLVADRDEIRTRPCVVIATSDAKVIPAMPNTARVKLEVHLFSQVDDTSAETHAQWSAAIGSMLRNKQALRASLDSETFIMHDLLPRETATTPDEARGRESVLTYEAVVSAV